MEQKKLSVEEIKAVAETAIAAKQAVADAKKALEDAGGDDESLIQALKDAETAATAAEAAAKALSQAPTLNGETERKKQKLLRKKGFINKELKSLGVEDEEEDDDDEEEDEDDLDRPLTHRDLQRIQAKNARKTTLEMADAIEDEDQREAVKAALRMVVATGDPEVDFGNAVAIANRERNDKILEEVGRRGTVRTARTKTGAAARIEAEFTPTADEAVYMRPPFNLTKKDILEARAKATAK